ncbi:amidohydrolase family protein [uncultured Amnibacterium sp.]|uniref:amidohydrolase family protein n=1 Tax=uncultured Amnibacterium sp. TaxID=1631851 RepID=UPI0035CA4B29
MLTDLEGVDLWDGTAHRGPSTLRFAHAGSDAVVASVEPASASSGLTAVPGLIDTHVHLIGESTGARVDFLTWPLTTRAEERVLHGLANARRALAAGVTTLRDLAADDVQFSLRRALDAGVVQGPRLVAHGVVGMTGGHADLFTPPAVVDRPPVADGPDECRRLVRHWARSGSDGIKIATSGGVLSVGDRPGWRGYTRAEVAAIVDEAHALGLRVAAHAHTEAGIELALDEGVDSIEHGTLVTAEQAARIAAAGITVAPTLLINDRIAAGRGASPEQAAKAVELVAERDQRLRAAVAAGVDLVLGTDANGFHVGFGEEHLELVRMAEVLGWSAERALRSATSRAAAAIGRDDLGRLVPGAKADLVLVRGAPWRDLGALALEAIVAVVVRGRVVHGAVPPGLRDQGTSRS